MLVYFFHCFVDFFRLKFHVLQNFNFSSVFKSVAHYKVGNSIHGNKINMSIFEMAYALFSSQENNK